MDLIRPIYQYMNLLEFENALAGICAIFKMEKFFSKSEISEIVEIYFKIPKELKISQRQNLKKLIKKFITLQADRLNLEQKKQILHELQNIHPHDTWSAQECIEICVELGEIESALKKFNRLIEQSFSYKRLCLIDNLCKKHRDLTEENELYRIQLMCACLRNDKVIIEQMYKQSLSNNGRGIIFKKVIELCNGGETIVPEGLEIANLKHQLNKKLTTEGKKKIVNKLYEFLAMSSNKQDILLLCAEYFVKAKRKTVAQKIVEFAKANLGSDEKLQTRVNELERIISKEKEDKIFPLEKDEIFDLAEDLFSGDISELLKPESKTTFILDTSLMDRNAYLIRQGLVSTDEIANKELQHYLVDPNAQNQKLEKEMMSALETISLPIKLELHKDLISALIMLEMLGPALRLCEELMPVLSGVENRISINYLIVVINFKKENYTNVIKLCDESIASLPLSDSDKIAFLKLMAASFQKKGEIRSSIGVKKLIDHLISSSNEVQE